MARLGDALFFIEGEAGVHFGRDAARNAFQNFRTKINRQLVAGFGDLLLLGFAALFAVGNGVINQMLKWASPAAFSSSEGLVVASSG
jgi:hypothetical protein